MLAYKFYLRDAIKNCLDLVGVLPERRMNPERISDESIINWGREYFGKDAKNEDIFFIESVLEDSEKGFYLPLSD
ncbi:MAG TPA: hypothetical protein VLK23_09210 [Thermodesulfobacteriota bacterium]|nr:hypothetical protein [Thermodesulfobacteriota bacterium]